METFHVSILCLFISFLYLSLHYLFNKKQLSGSSSSSAVPPGKTGWPLIGETLEFISTGRQGQPEKFVLDRMSRHSRDVFRTHLMGEPFAVFCGSEGNKFLFSNENKLVRVWWPSSIHKIISGSNQTSIAGEEGANLRRILPNFIKPESLHGYIGIMDEIAQRHFAEKWENKEEVVVLPLAKDYTFLLACRLFFSIEDPGHIAELAESFNAMTSGFLSLPINLPGTRFHKAIKAGDLIRKEILSIIQQRKDDLAQGKVSPTQDILSHMLYTGSDENENGESEAEHNLVGKITGLLIAGHDNASIICTFLVKYLAEFPEIYEAVREEQMQIATSKAPGQSLSWEDIQKMKYSWNVACEVLRLAPPGPGAFREAIVDFTYKGFSIPKGWKLFWNVNSTHRNAEFFPDPEKFDPSRYEGFGPAPYTFVPFGGGPRMCPGKEYARLEILMFMHHLVKRFKWEKTIPDEQVVVDPIRVPIKGLPIRLFPCKAQSNN